MKPIFMYISILSLILVGDVSAFGISKPLFKLRQTGDNPKIEGRVIDKSNGMPLENVIIRWKGTNQNVLSNHDGIYRISKHPEITKLVFSKAGWMEKTMRARTKKTAEIRMKKVKRESIPVQPNEDMPPDSLLHRMMPLP